MKNKLENQKPLITFAVFAYNQENFVCDAVRAAFAQTYQPLEIILSDDCSIDRTYEIIQKMAAAYSGPHSIFVRKNSKNFGLLTHINEVHKISKGKIIVMAAGDDVSIPDRTLRHYEQYEDRVVQAVCSAHNTFDEHQKFTPLGFHHESEPSPMWHCLNIGGVGHGATYSYRREIFESPHYVSGAIEAEDRILPLRASLVGKTRYLDEILVTCRVFNDSNTVARKRSSRRWHKNPAHRAEIRDTLSYYKRSSIKSYIYGTILEICVRTASRHRDVYCCQGQFDKYAEKMFWSFLLIPFRLVRWFEKIANKRKNTQKKP